MTRDKERGFYGNLFYAAPELIQKDQPHSKESDVFSIGMIMHEVETGSPPEFDTGDRPKLPPNLPESYRQIMEKCLDPEPTNRPSTKELVEFFRDCM